MFRTHHIAVASAILTLLSAGHSFAEEIPVSGEIVDAVSIDPGAFMRTGGDIVIVQGIENEEFLTGDLVGSMHVTGTFLVHVKTGEGILFGHIDWSDPNAEGGFRGPFYGTISGAFGPGLGSVDLEWTLHGYGEHQGLRARIDNDGPFTLPQTYQGVIIVPAGL
jgi:hypothetical protein